MENVLSFLNCHPEQWLSFVSMFLGTDSDYTFLSATGLIFLLLLCCLFLKPWLPTLWKSKDIQKPQLRAKRRRGGTLRDQRTGQGEAEEERKLLSILKSPPGQHHDITHFRQLLCPDPLCEVCNTTTAKVSRLLSRASLEDAAHTTSHLSSIASVTKSSLTPTSAISAISAGQPIPASLTEQSLLQPTTRPPSQVTPLADLLSPLVQGDLVSPEPSPPLDPRVPVDRFPSEPLDSPSCPPHHSQEKETVLQPETLLFLDDSSSDLSTDDLSSAEGSFGVHSTAYQVEPGSLRLPRSAASSLLERDIKKTDDFLMCSEQEKGAESFAKQHEPDYPLTTSGRRPASADDQQHSALSCPLWSSEGKPKELHMNHQFAGPKNLEDHVEQNCSQFCHFPGLLRQSLNPLVHTSGDCFSEISNIFKDHESPVFPQTSLLSLPEVQPQPLSHTLPQSQTHHLHLVQAQGQLQTSAAVLPDPALAQSGTWEMCFHSTQSEVLPLTLSEVRNLEYNTLPKVQESVWRLPSVVHNFQEDIDLPAHKPPSVTESPKPQVPVSMLPKKHTFSSELRETLEHHLQKKLIQHQWGLPPRALKSLSVVCPQTQHPVTSESKGSHGINCVSLLKGQSSKDLKNFELSQPRFHERIQETLPLQKGVGKRQGQSPEIGFKNNQSGHPRGAPQSVLGSDSETDLERFTGKTSRASCVSIRQNQLIKALEVHLCKKFEEICKGHIPDTVNISRYSTSLTLSLAEESPRQIQDRHLAPLEGKESYQNISQNISFLSYSKQKMLEDHIKTFHSRMMWRLPYKVQKATEIFSTKKDSSQALSDSHFPSSDKSVSGVHPKTGVYKPLRESTNAFQAHIVKTPNSVLDGPCPATSLVDKERQRDPRRSPSSTTHELTGNIQTMKDGTQIFLNPRHKVDKASQKQTLQAKRRSPRLPTRLAGAGPEIKERRMSSGSDTERLPSKMTTKLDYFPVCNKAGATFKAQEVSARQSQLSNILMSNKLERISGKDVSTCKPETSLTTERSPGRTVVPQDLKSSGFKNQLLSELIFEMESVRQNQAQGLPTDVSLTSNDLNPKTLFRRDQGAHCEDTETFQDNIKTHMEQGQEPWGPQHVLCQYQDKKFLSAERTYSLTLKTGDPSGINAGQDAYQGRKRSCPDQDRTLEKTSGSKSSPALSLKRQPPPESLFKNKMKHFFQWLCPTMRHRMQESSKEKTGTPSSCAQSRDLGKGRVGLTGNSKDWKVSRSFAKFFRQNVQGERFLPHK